MRLDRFISHHTRLGKKRSRALIENCEVRVNKHIVRDPLLRVDRFDTITCGSETLQEHQAHYLMMHKPAGILSATKDPEFKTAIDLIDTPYAHELHIAGRLDRASTGLLLLTNDGRWSKQLTEPEQNVAKVYEVGLRDPIEERYHEIFANGIYLAYEDHTTQPVTFTQLNERRVEVTLHEGRYHQIKRMFHAVGNQVTSLHRTRIGKIELGDLSTGAFQTIEADAIF
ncbi:pseudouridine synthase [Rubritalea marina]|uniref:pseudouridine synthase n=1 Tax=Rubritalea marina TaxID=361055 RepID=UPI00038222D5|nr:pseudouridine synthase [Rubritalea marina]